MLSEIVPGGPSNSDTGLVRIKPINSTWHKKSPLGVWVWMGEKGVFMVKALKLINSMKPFLGEISVSPSQWKHQPLTGVVQTDERFY